MALGGLRGFVCCGLVAFSGYSGGAPSGTGNTYKLDLLPRALRSFQSEMHTCNRYAVTTSIV